MGTLASFCLMAIGARELNGQLDTFQVLFFRSLIGLLIISVVIVALGAPKLFTTRRVKLHTFRNVFHFGGQYGWFVGIGLLPLAEVFAIEFTVPVWTALIACTFLGEKLTFRKVISIVLGLAGVMVIVKPGIGIMSAASITVLIAAICYAVSHASTKGLSSSEHPLTILFYMCLIQLPIGLVFSLSDWALPSGNEWGWVLVVGITALSAHYCMTKAMQSAEVTMVVTMDFLRLPIIALVGVLVYSESLELSLFIGAALMLFGNLVNIYKPNRKSGSAASR